jgi:hypothetical protein
MSSMRLLVGAMGVDEDVDVGHQHGGSTAQTATILRFAHRSEVGRLVCHATLFLAEDQHPEALGSRALLPLVASQMLAESVLEQPAQGYSGRGRGGLRASKDVFVEYHRGSHTGDHKDASTTNQPS